MRLTPGSALGPYEISGPIGAGGMGEVYRARDTRLGREVAIKVLPREVTADPERLLRFEREARSSSVLNHPNIVTIHDFAGAGDDRYLVMELIRGESLRDLLRNGALPLRRMLSIAAGIADGLAAAHAAGIVHRDLKPENVMITSDGTPKILDFGLVKPADEQTELAQHGETAVKVTSAGMILGTASYMSPEQARGERVGIQSDQFSLGLILHEMATGSHPFRRSSTFETVTAILNEEPPPLGDRFPEPLVWVIERCLARNPGERYASTTDLARDLATLRDRASSKAPARPTAGRPARAPRWLVVGVATAAAVLATALALTWYPRRAAESAGVTEPLQVDLAVPGIDPLFTEVAVPVAISPDGRYIAVNGVTADGGQHLWLRDLSSGEMRKIADGAFAPAWSPDGRAIAFYADGKLKTLPIDGGPPTILGDASPESLPTWQGDTILYTQYSGGPDRVGLYRVVVSAGSAERIIGPTEASAGVMLPWWPHFLPDGKRFLFIRLMPGSDGKTLQRVLMVASLDDLTPKRIQAVESRAVFIDGYLLFVREGTLLAQRFDPEGATLEGDAMPLVNGVHFFQSTGTAAFSVTPNALVWRSTRRPVRLAWYDRTGIETGTIAEGVFDASGRLSPDGTKYAVGGIDSGRGTSDLWLHDLSRGNAERLTFDWTDQKTPVWATDGRTLYYRSDGFGGPPDVAQLNLAQQTLSLLHRGPTVEQPEDVSSDGKWLLFTALSPSGGDIHVLPLDPPGEPRPFVTTPFSELSPRFSPDVKYVAYSSNVSGRPEIYVRPFDGSAAPLRVSTDGGTLPRWSSDGRELFFLAPSGRLMSASFDGSFGTPRLLFQAQAATSFEPSPDGQRFLLHLDERRSEPAIHLLLNWKSRLKRSFE